MKKNKGCFIPTLFGFFFCGFFTFQCLKGAFSADYVQIALLIMGILFGLFALLTLLSFFINKNTRFISWIANWEKWKIFRYLPSAVAIVCFILSINCYRNKDKQYNSEYVEIILKQTNYSKIQTNGKGHRYVHIETKEYPQYKFDIGGVTLKNLNSNYYVDNVKRGDTLLAKISKEAYNKKIVKTEPLGFTDKTINYHFISVYGLKHKNIELLSTDAYESTKENNSIGVMFFFIAVGGYFLYLQKQLNKEKKQKEANNQI